MASYGKTLFPVTGNQDSVGHGVELQFNPNIFVSTVSTHWNLRLKKVYENSLKTNF